MEYQLINENPSTKDVVQQFLTNRQVFRDAKEFFTLDWDCVQSPYDLENIEAAVDLLVEHLEKNSTIGVVVDVDMDGMTSAALLINYMEDQREYNYPDKTFKFVPIFHELKEHGLGDMELMRRARDEVNPQLLIVPDASGNIIQYEALTALGIDVLVLDHHDMPLMTPAGPGRVVIVNNQQSPKYKNKDLSGVGVVYQFCRVFDDKVLDINADRYLDLVALGLVGDVMNLQSDETRFLVNQGLAVDSNLVDALKFKYAYQMKGDWNPHQISFTINSAMNAICRIGDLKEKDLVFKLLLNRENMKMVKDGTRGHTGDVALAYEAIRVMSNCKSRQDSRKKKLTAMVDTLIQKKKLFNNKIIVVTISDFETKEKALGGLIAMELTKVYNRPAVVLFKKPDNQYAGSVRVPAYIDAFENWKDQCTLSGLTNFASGHQRAFGIGFDNMDKVNEFVEYFNEKYKDIPVSQCYRVDYAFDANDIESWDVCGTLGEMKDIYGTGLEQPYVAITNVPLTRKNVYLAGTQGRCPTLKVTLPNNMTLIKFFSSQEEYDSLILPYENGVEQYYTATFIGEPQLNEFAGKITPQLKIIDYEVGDCAAYDF